MTLLDPEALLPLLAAVPAFEGIPVESLRWFIEQSEQRLGKPGEISFEAGSPASHMIVLLEGGIEARGALGKEDVVFEFRQGRITGVLPFSRMEKYPLSSYVKEPTRALMFPRDKFPDLYQKIPELVPRLVSILTDRVRESTTISTQQEKLAALGKMTAGLAHELNNPAAAARRASQTARDLFGCFRALMDDFAMLSVSPEVLAAVKQLELEASRTIANPPALDSLARSDREQELAEWMEEQGFEHAWHYAAPLVEAGLERDLVAQKTADWDKDTIEAVLGRLAASIQLEQVLAQMFDATTRMSELVKAMKEYTFLDRAALVEFDLNQNIDTTLKIFRYRFKKGIELVTDYDTSLPLICGNGGQLNQVWTNLIDNALDAIDGNEARKGPGRLIVRTRREPTMARVEVEDNGGGISPEVAQKIFDPFFTTKPLGEGTGLGLDMVYRIIRQHHGSIRFEPRPEGTVFLVQIPFEPPRNGA